YVLVTHHFAAQHFGVLRLYSLRTGRTDARALRRLDRIYAFVVGGVFVAAAEAVAGTICYIDVWIDPWLDPARVAAAAATIAGAATILVGAGTLGMVAMEFRTERP